MGNGKGSACPTQRITSMILAMATAVAVIASWITGDQWHIASGLVIAAGASLIVRLALHREFCDVVDGNAKGLNPVSWVKEEYHRLKTVRNDLICDMEKFQKQTAEQGKTLLHLFDEMTEQHETAMEHVGETVQAVGSVDKSIRQIAINTERASQEAHDTRQSAENEVTTLLNAITNMHKVVSMVSQSAETIERLGEASEQIGQILTVIDDIASRTNLLALNAAIEAARAGEHGRGFAVVADEVRHLAEKTTSATSEINEVISLIQNTTDESIHGIRDGVKGVNDGVEILTETGESLAEMVGRLEGVVEAIDTIANAAEDQSEATTAINGAVKSLVRSSRMAAIKVEEASQYANEFIADLTESESMCETDELSSERLLAPQPAVG